LVKGLTRDGQTLGPHFVQGRLNTREYMRVIRYHVVQGDFRRKNFKQSLKPVRNMTFRSSGQRVLFKNSELSEEKPCGS